MKPFAIELDATGKGRDVDAAAACAHRPEPARFVWVHLDGNAADTVEWLDGHAGVPRPVVLALTAIETRPRCEQIGAGALINLRGPAEDDTLDADDRLVSIRVWVEAGRAISVGFRPLAGLDALRDKMHDGAITDPGDLVSILAVILTKRIDPVIGDLDEAVDACETRLDATSAFETRRRIARARSDAIAYRRFVAPERDALLRMAELDADWLADDDRLHLREAADRFARMAEQLEAVRERAALIHEQLTDLRSEQIESRALLLSIVALIFLPLTFLTGLLGMNVDGIPFAHEPWAFAAVCGLCLAIALAITGWFAWANWLGTR